MKRFGMFCGVLLWASCTAASAQSGSFTVTQRGHQVGTASFQVTANGNGYDSTSSVKVSMQGLDYALSKTERLDSTNRIERVQVSATVNNSAVYVTGKPDAAQFLLNISANGRGSTTRLASHTASVFLPDFDPGALETLLALNVTQGGRDLWAIIPKQAGSVTAVQMATYPDEQGTWNGKPIAVRHLVATIGEERTELFAGPQNELLQAELPQAGLALVRQGFVLTPPKKPIAPPDQQEPQQ